MVGVLLFVFVYAAGLSILISWLKLLHLMYINEIHFDISFSHTFLFSSRANIFLIL